jgi:hypothetical protein
MSLFLDGGGKERSAGMPDRTVMGPIDQGRIRSLASLLIDPSIQVDKSTGRQRQGVVSPYGESGLNVCDSLDHHSLGREVGAELRPDGLRLTVAHLDAQQLPAPVLVHSHGDDGGAGADLLDLAQAALDVGGVEVDEA